VPQWENLQNTVNRTTLSFSDLVSGSDFCQ
jgi:hypothetical protein